MADEGIKKATIQKSLLPAINGNTQSYIIRYRIATEDKNRYSHWSPRYNLLVPNATEITSANRSVQISGTGSSKILTAVWIPTTSSNNNFDIYLKVGTGSYEYKATVSTPSYSTIVPSGTEIGLAVQVLTTPKKRFSNLTLFEEIQQS